MKGRNRRRSSTVFRSESADVPKETNTTNEAKEAKAVITSSQADDGDDVAVRTQMEVNDYTANELEFEKAKLKSMVRINSSGNLAEVIQ